MFLKPLRHEVDGTAVGFIEFLERRVLGPCPALRAREGLCPRVPRYQQSTDLQPRVAQGFGIQTLPVKAESRAVSLGKKIELTLVTDITGSRFVDWLQASTTAFSDSGYWSGTVRSFSRRQPSTRAWRIVSTNGTVLPVAGQPPSG